MATGKGDKDGASAVRQLSQGSPIPVVSEQRQRQGRGRGRAEQGEGFGDPCEAPAVTDHSPSAPSQRPGDPERSIFVRLREGGYRLRDHTLFHLYLSTSPCGDARLNSPHEATAERKAPSLPVTQPPPPGHLGAGRLGRWARMASAAPPSSLQNLGLSPGHRAGWPGGRRPETRSRCQFHGTARRGSPVPGRGPGPDALGLRCLPRRRLCGG